jgi:hypothetical protein
VAALPWFRVADRAGPGPARCRLRLSTPLLVGVQSTVAWHHRSVVTGANIFSRYLDQSLGAAAFDAIFNHAIAAALAHAPATLQAQVPRDINAVIGALHAGHLPRTADNYLHHAIYVATHDV